MSLLLDAFNDLMQRGGWVMWPLLVLSIVACTLMFERVWFWLLNNRPGRAWMVGRVCDKFRAGDLDGVSEMVKDDSSVYGRAARHVIAEAKRGRPTAGVSPGITDALAAEIIETQRPRIERFMPTLSTIITAAPLLGILGTVTGIIASFDLLSQGPAATDPRAVSGGIAEALLTTAAGLTVALVVLFPYNAFRAQIDRTLGRLETIVAAASRVSVPHPPADKAEPPSDKA